MGSIAKSDHQNSPPIPDNLSGGSGVLPEKGNDPKIIAIGDAIARRKKLNGAATKKSQNYKSKKNELTLEPAAQVGDLIEQVDQNPPYVVAKWVAPHTPCIIRGVDSESKIRAIIYPGQKKIREFYYTGDHLVRIETIEGDDENTKVVYSFDPFTNSWSMIHDGIVGLLDGKINLTEEGVLQIEIDKAGTAREEHPDGSVKLVNNCFEPRKVRLSVPEMEFLNIVSHDLRTPLMSVQGLLTLLSSGALGLLSHKAKHRIEGVEIEVERLIRLVNELLEAGLVNSNKENLEFEEVPVNELFDATVFALDNLAQEKDITIDYLESELSVRVNVDSFIRVMVNLVANAVKYSPPGELIKLFAQSKENMVEICVQDFGKGISETDFDRIFNNFQCGNDEDRTENGGIGLGLAICKSIVEAHSGEIGLDSKPGEGSTFWVRIPV